MRDNRPVDALGPSLDRLKAFLAVAEAGGFTAAARRLGLGKNALSQQVAQLEKELGTPLFVRTTRRVTPTDAGRQLHQTCLPLLRDLGMALEAASDSQPIGKLRITAPTDYVTTVLNRPLAEFARLYPQLQIELIADNRVLDLVAEGIDLGVRLGWLRDSSLRASKIGEFSLLLVAAPDYATRAGLPQHPSDLARHDWVALNVLPHPWSWRFSGPDGARCSVRVRQGLSANTMDGVLALVLGGAGITIATDFSVTRHLHDGTLLQVLPEWRLPAAGIYLTWPGTRQESARLRTLIRFLREWFERH